MLRVVIATFAALMSCAALAQSYPSRPIRLYLPQPAGSPVDVVLRRAIDDMQPRLGQPVVIENRPGGNSVVAAEACARATPDGHTLCVLNSDPVISNPHLLKNLPYDSLKDFKPITMLYYILSGLFVKAALPAASVKELEAYAKAHPSELNMGTFGPRSTLDLTRLYLNARWGTNMQGIPYPGGPQVLQAVASGAVDTAALGAYGGLSLLKANKVKLLAVTGAKRLTMFPDIPTFAELGMEDVPSGASWWGLLGPAALPAAVVQRVNSEWVRTFREPKFVAFLTDNITEPNVGTPEAFAEAIRAGYERSGRLAKQFNLQPE
jgi:tripartite-type tricarboxylate transporter receptor subunit TctC